VRIEGPNFRHVDVCVLCLRALRAQMSVSLVCVCVCAHWGPKCLSVLCACFASARIEGPNIRQCVCVLCLCALRALGYTPLRCNVWVLHLIEVKRVGVTPHWGVTCGCYTSLRWTRGCYTSMRCNVRVLHLVTCGCYTSLRCNVQVLHLIEV